AIKREAVLAAVVVAEEIEPSDEDILQALTPSAEREGVAAEELLERLRKSDKLGRLREELATRQAIELLVREAKPIGMDQARAREKLWTPGQDEPAAATGKPRRGSGKSAKDEPGSKLWTPGS